MLSHWVSVSVSVTQSWCGVDGDMERRRRRKRRRELGEEWKVGLAEKMSYLWCLLFGYTGYDVWGQSEEADGAGSMAECCVVVKGSSYVWGCVYISGGRWMDGLIDGWVGESKRWWW